MITQEQFTEIANAAMDRVTPSRRLCDGCGKASHCLVWIPPQREQHLCSSCYEKYTTYVGQGILALSRETVVQYNKGVLT
jgi:hypothetical protein